jgi:hypothetical protein
MAKRAGNVDTQERRQRLEAFFDRTNTFKTGLQTLRGHSTRFGYRAGQSAAAIHL